jgi:hypothetical protein
MRLKRVLCTFTIGLTAASFVANAEIESSELTITLVDSQLNNSSWAAANLLDEDLSSRWLSRSQNNDINFVVGTGPTASCLTGVNINNYGANDRSVERFIILTTENDSLANDAGTAGWLPVVADTNPSEAINAVLWAQGGRLVSTDSQVNSTSWAAENMFDGDYASRWLSRNGNSIHEFAFDSDWNGTQGDAVNIESVSIRNYGVNDRAVRFFQVEVTSDGSNWEKLEVPGTGVGDPNFDFALKFEGASLSGIDSQVNTTTWAAENLHDGDQNTRWLSRNGNNTITFEFDPDLDTETARTDADDQFTLHEIYLENYGVNDRSIAQFQIEVLRAGEAEFEKVDVPGSTAGESDFNFLLAQEGGVLTEINQEVNNTTWAASNIHDGDRNTRWLSRSGNNTLAFSWDTDFDGLTSDQGDADDSFTLEAFYLQNYGVNDRSVRQFQIEYQTTANSNWQKLEVPGSAIGDANYEYLLAQNGASLSFIDQEINSTTWAAANLHDGDQNTRWLSRQQGNTLEFVFDVDHDGTSGDAINFDRIEMINYGNNDRSVATFEVEALVLGAWQPVLLSDNSTLFSAAMTSSEQFWTVQTVNNATSLRIRTLTNHGDSRFTGMAEFRVRGISQTPSTIFTASMNADGEIFSLDPDDQVTNVTAIRLRTINNHGDGRFIGASEFRALGDSLFPSHTFNAEMNGDGQSFVLDEAKRPTNVVAVRLITINNHGDGRFIGARALELRGPSLGPSHVFTAPMTADEHIINLDNEDRVTGAIGARLLTIRNHGDGQFIGLREFGLLGTNNGPDYVFDLEDFQSANNSTQSFTFSQRQASVFRLHTISNQGDSRFTGLSELSIEGIDRECGEPPPVAVYLLEHDGVGLTCNTEQMTLRACTNADCSVLSDEPTEVTFTSGNWVGGNTFNFIGQTTVTLEQTTPATVALSLSSASPVAPLSCSPSCSIDFSSAGLAFFNTQTNASILPTQIAQAPLSDIGIQAVQDNNGECSALVSGNQSVTLGFDCIAPVGAMYSPNICRVPFAGIPVQGDGSGTSTGNITLTFDSNGEASLAGFSYADAGRLSLTASTVADGIEFTAGQSTVDVIPAQLELNAQQLGTPKTVAGENFTLNVRAVGALGDQLPGYQPGQLQFALTRDVPSTGGEEGVLNITSGFSVTSALTSSFIDAPTLSLVNGLFQSTVVNYSEVGSITLDVRDASYLGNTLDALAQNLGEFRPAYFEVEQVGDARFANTNGDFTYVGQTFTTELGSEPSLSVTAKNANGQTTLNYATDLWRLLPDQSAVQNGLSFQNLSTYSGTLSTVSAGDAPDLSNENVYDGQATLRIDNTRLRFDKVNETGQIFPLISPFDGTLDITYSAGLLTDQDGVCWQSSYPNGCESFTITPTVFSDQRHGRLRLVNAYGPETHALRVPIEAEYFINGSWILNTDDNQTPINYSSSASQVTLSAITTPDLTGLVGESSASGFLALGQSDGTDLRLNPPGSGNTGELQLLLNPSASGALWAEFLNFDWDGDGDIDADDAPSSQVSFGLFRGNDRIFHSREVN